MAVFLTVQFESQPHRMYKPADQRPETGLPGTHLTPLNFVVFKVSPQRNQLI